MTAAAHPDPHLLAVARGDAPADVCFHGGRVVNVFTREIIEADVSVSRGCFAAVGAPREAMRTIDVSGRYLLPSFIDAHMHVESTMLLPREFARVALPHGTTGVVFDPHEIANVHGVDGIRLLMDDAAKVPMHMMFAASSCVPASPLETSGAALDAGDLAPLFDDVRVVALAEMMNFPGVVHADPGVLEKVRLGLAQRLVDGHCPGLSGAGLQAYTAAGISSDHECTTAAEAREKLQLGMRIYLREGSAARNLEALLPVVDDRNAHRFCFCTDDRHPGDLVEAGHIDHVVRKAIRLGLDPATAIAMASLHVADHYRQPQIGAIAPGRSADCIICDDLDDIQPRQVYCRGVEVAADGVYTGPRMAAFENTQRIPIGGSVRLPDGFGGDSLRIAAADSGAALIRVIGMDPHQLLTEHLTMPPRVVDGAYVSDVERDVLKIAVIERHRASGNIGLGFIHGFGLQRGAIGSTVGHDSHNLTLVGANDADMAVAARALAEAGGGQCVVEGGDVRALLRLPIAGLMSDQAADTVASAQATVLRAAAALGCPHHDPFMPLSFMPLSVIPHLKLSDRGLVDVDAFAIVPLEVCVTTGDPGMPG